MSLRTWLPLVAVLTLGVARPAFPCEGNPSCTCNHKKGDAAKTTAAVDLKGAKTVELSVTENGFEPASVKVAKGVPLKLVVTRKTDKTCAKQIVVKDYGINVELPLNKAVEVSLTPKAAGNIRYACSMDMIAGVLVVE